MSWLNILGVAGAIIGIASMTGLGFQQGRVTGLRGDVDDYEKRLSVAREEIDELKAGREEDARTIASMRSDIRLLQSMVTGEVQWRATVDLMEHHHTRAERYWEATSETLERILAELRESA